MQSIETGAGTQCSGVKFSGGGESQRSIKRGGRGGRHPHVGGKFTLGDDVGLFHSAGSRSVECTAARLFNHPSLGFFRSLPPFVRSAARVRAFRWCFGETVRVWEGHPYWPPAQFHGVPPRVLRLRPVLRGGLSPVRPSPLSAQRGQHSSSFWNFIGHDSLAHRCLLHRDLPSLQWHLMHFISPKGCTVGCHSSPLWNTCS